MASHDPATQLLERITVDVFIKMEPESETAMTHQMRLPSSYRACANVAKVLFLDLTSFRKSATRCCGQNV